MEGHSRTQRRYQNLWHSARLYTNRNLHKGSVRAMKQELIEKCLQWSVDFRKNNPQLTGVIETENAHGRTLLILRFENKRNQEIELLVWESGEAEYMFGEFGEIYVAESLKFEEGRDAILFLEERFSGNSEFLK